MDGLTSLEGLGIGRCPGINKFPQGLLQRLPALKSLIMYGCPDLQRLCRVGGEYFDLVSSIPEKDIPQPDEPEIKKFVSCSPGVSVGLQVAEVRMLLHLFIALQLCISFDP